jgi:hypothetical protein
MSNFKEKLKRTEEELRTMDTLKNILFRCLNEEVTSAQDKIEQIEIYELEKKEDIIKVYREFIGDLYNELVQEFNRVVEILDDNKDFIAHKIMKDSNLDLGCDNTIYYKGTSYEKLISKIHDRCLDFIENNNYIIKNKNINMREKVKKLTCNIRKVKNTLETYNIDYRIQ